MTSSLELKISSKLLISAFYKVEKMARMIEKILWNLI